MRCLRVDLILERIPCGKHELSAATVVLPLTTNLICLCLRVLNKALLDWVRSEMVAFVAKEVFPVTSAWTIHVMSLAYLDQNLWWENGTAELLLGCEAMIYHGQKLFDLKDPVNPDLRIEMCVQCQAWMVSGIGVVTRGNDHYVCQGDVDRCQYCAWNVVSCHPFYISGHPRPQCSQECKASPCHTRASPWVALYQVHCEEAPWVPV